MIKRLSMLAMAIGLFAAGSNLQAQCTKGAKECEKGKSCCAAKQAEPGISQLKEVTKDDVAKFVTANNVTIVDARDAESYAAGHIDGAVNAADMVLPTDKNAPIVFYCGGLKCPMAAMAANAALKNGYTNVMVFRGGWAAWSNG